MRDALTRLPDGEGWFEDVCDGDGILDAGETEDRTFTIRMHVAKSGDRLRVDFTGSDPAVPGPFNAPLTVTASGVFCALKMIADPNRSEEHTSELQSLMRISYAVFCSKKKKQVQHHTHPTINFRQ